MKIPRFTNLSPDLTIRPEGALPGEQESVSVLISTHRLDSKLPWTLASLAAVDDVELEVLVFDDTPNQDLAIAGDWEDRLRVVRRDVSASCGLGYARSKLMSKAEGDIIIVVDDDFIVDANTIRDLAAVHSCTSDTVIASSPLYFVREDFCRDVSPEATQELVRHGELGNIASAYLMDSHYTVQRYGAYLNSLDRGILTLLAGHSSFVSFRSDTPRRLGIDYRPIRRGEDSAFGDEALTRGAKFAWCQAGFALHIGMTEMAKLDRSSEAFHSYETWRRGTCFGWLPSSGRPHNLPERGLDRTWARPTVAICLYLQGRNRSEVAKILDNMSRWGIRDWIVTVGDVDQLDADSKAVIDQFSLDDRRYCDAKEFVEIRWNATWQAFITAREFGDVQRLIHPLRDWPMGRLQRTPEWSVLRGYISRSSRLARLPSEQEPGDRSRSHHTLKVDQEVLPTPSDIKALQTESICGAQLIGSPDALLFMDTGAVVPIDEDHVTGMDIGQRCNLWTSAPNLDRVVRDRADELRMLLRRGLALEVADPVNEILGDDFVLGGSSHDSYLQWRVKQKRGLLTLSAGQKWQEVALGVIAVTKRPNMLAGLLGSISRQVHPASGLLLVCHGWTPTRDQIAQIRSLEIPVTTVMTAGQTNFGSTFAHALSIFEHGDWCVKIDDDDNYGARFLQEFALAISDQPQIDFIGAHAEFVELVGADGKRNLTQRPIGWQREPGRYEPGCPSGAAMCFRREYASEISPNLLGASGGIDVILGMGLNQAGAKLSVVDGLNYAVRRYADAGHAHTWVSRQINPIRTWSAGEYGNLEHFWANG